MTGAQLAASFRLAARSQAMRKRPFGPTGIDVPIIGQGTWRVADSRAAAPTVQEGISLGMTHIDTAELYERNSGSETMLGELLSQPARAGGVLRDHVFLASKVMPPHDTAKGVRSACKDSLVYLQTDCIDLYYHHWRGAVPMAETLQAMAELVDIGWVRYVGVSNYDVEDLDEAKSILGSGKLAANQVLYHLEERGAEAEVIPWCKRNNVAFVGYSPFGAGNFLSERKGRSVVESVAERLGKTSRQVALAFLTREPHLFTIPKAEQLAHVRDNAGGDFDLSAEALAEIDATFAVSTHLVHH